MMKKIKDFILLVKVELAICVGVPILTAVLLNTSAVRDQNHFFMIMIGLFCALAYGIVKMYFTLRKGGVISNDAGEDPFKAKSTKYRVAITIVAVFMPVSGLMLNNHFMWDVSGVFGDFTNPWFYIIAVVNGLLMLADIRDNKLGVFLFYLKIIGFTYITYFTIVFIPLLPYGFIGLLVYGLGVFVFVPAAVFTFELYQILRDVRVLKRKFEFGVIVAVIFGIVTIPTVLTADFSIDKTNFNNALAYLSADSAEMPAANVDIPRLKGTLNYINNILETSQSNRNFFNVFNSGGSIPIISRVYRLVALDDRILSTDTSQKLSRIFLGTGDNQPINTDSGRSQNVNIINADTDTEFDEETGVYKTWVNLEIENNSGGSLAEYRTEFYLPEGCFIKDYYLNIGSERRQGILADKRAALITYNNIIRTPKDPGIIYFKSDNVIELRVYPFGFNEIRETGFLVWHNQSEVLTIDGEEIRLPAGDSGEAPIDMQGVSFIPASYKENLPVSERTPKYYFILDASEGSPYNEHLKKALDYMSYNEITNAEVYAASYRVYKVSSLENTVSSIENTVDGADNSTSNGVKCEGGFNLPLAMELIFKGNENSDLQYPVIIAVSDNIYKAPEFQRGNLIKQFPESEFYYNLGYDLSLTPYSFSESKRLDVVKSPILSRALDYNGFIAADNMKSEIVITGDIGNYSANEYQNALILYAKCSRYSSDVDAQIDLVRESFRQRLLSRYTAFTVLETQEQEKSLLELQAKFLSGGVTGAPAVMMDEPGLLIFMILALAIAFIRLRKSKYSIPS
ncbi:MAG: MSEP-CTERM sorting domain-containing protein [Oscillospiraceae bacterium]|nr:MSEP-CTERM sorting domain-containing protein [Oscillospiraceae bacterium]